MDVEWNAEFLFALVLFFIALGLAIWIVLAKRTGRVLNDAVGIWLVRRKLIKQNHPVASWIFLIAVLGYAGLHLVLDSQWKHYSRQ